MNPKSNWSSMKKTVGELGLCTGKDGQPTRHLELRAEFEWKTQPSRKSSRSSVNESKANITKEIKLMERAERSEKKRKKQKQNSPPSASVTGSKKIKVSGVGIRLKDGKGDPHIQDNQD